MTAVIRSYPLLDMAVRSEDGGRVVEALAAVWDVETSVRDHQGEYREVLRSTLFSDWLRSGRSPAVLYNHGLDVWGRPSDRFSMPLGTPIEIRSDAKGLMTVTRYAQTELADEVLGLIRDGAIRGQSFRAVWEQSSPASGFFRGGKQLVERHRGTLIEYGPTPTPVYDAAEILSVRSLTELVDGLSDSDRNALAMMLTQGTPLDAPAPDGRTASEGDQPPEPDPGPTLDSTPLDLLVARMEARRRRMQAA